MTRLVNTGSNGRNTNRVIHTDPDCMHVTENSMPPEDAPVDAEDLENCKWCDGERDRVQNQHRDCPFCGETVPKLPAHLPCEGVE
jgi:hypothetical protein